MNDHSELKSIAEDCQQHQPLRFMRSHGALYIRNDNGIVFDVHQNRSFPEFMAQNKDYADLVLAATPDAILALIAENDRLKSDNREMTEFKRHMVELRETHGFESWAAALVEVDKLRAENELLCSKIASMNVSGFGDAFYQVAERLGVTGARPVSPMQVFTSEVLPALDKAIKDAERYRWLRDRDLNTIQSGGVFIGDTPRNVVLSGADADAAVDSAIALEQRPLPAGCWEWVVPKGTEAPCRGCSGFGTIQTGIDEAPSTVCNSCDGTGKETGHDQP